MQTGATKDEGERWRKLPCTSREAASADDEEMKVELLYIPDCPNLLPAVETVRDVLREQGLPQDILQIEVIDPAQAAALFFPGSPTVRVDGKDVEPNVTVAASIGISCRTYLVDGRRQGVPIGKWIRDAILSSSLE